MSKKFIIGLVALVSALCIYYLSFTFIARGVTGDAEAFATSSDGKVNPSMKQKYLDSIYEKPVFSFLGIEYTLKEVKSIELSLGLDLQGGMNVTLEVSPVELIKALAGPNARDNAFKQALEKATQAQKEKQDRFALLFVDAFKEIEGDEKLARIFANSLNRGSSRQITSKSTDKEILQMLDAEIEDAIDRSFEILRTRIDKFGVIQPNIQKIANSGRIQVELPGVENPQRVRNLLVATSQLEFIPVFYTFEIGEELQQLNNYLLTVEKDAKSNDSIASLTTTEDNAANLLAADTTLGLSDLAADADSANVAATAADSLADKVSSFFRLNLDQQGYGFYYDLKDTAKINKILRMPQVQAIFPSNLTFVWEKKGTDKKEGGKMLELIPVKKGRGQKAELEGDAIEDANFNISTNGRGYEISMKMNTIGAKKWKKMTAEASSNANMKRRIAIVMDEYCYSAPTVQNEIPNGYSSITGNFTLDEAKDLTNILKSGKLPAPLRIVEEVVVGPTLGKEAIASGIYSLFAGLAAVMLLMVAYYKRGGFIADIALLFNVLFTMGIMATMNSVLTLPGIAGIVLTIGMAVDANVLIFERIKEELRAGKSLLNAIDLGYEKAFSSILDSNITTIITATILWWLGSGPIQGFATTLFIGIVCSFVTAVVISKIILVALVKGKDEKDVTFTTALSRNLFQNLSFDIISKRKIAYIGSSLVLALGLGSIFVQGGLNLGVDFKGGRSYVIEFNKAIGAGELKTALAGEFKNAGTEVKTYGSDNKMKVTTSYLIDDESQEGDIAVDNAIKTGLDKFAGKDSYTIAYSTKVGATVVDDIVNASAMSMIIALIGIFIYILIRFRKWQFSLGGVVALFHDSLMVVAVFSLVRMIGISFEIDQVFVAAILTIVGFSINDTVIVFDRVREVLDSTKKDYSQLKKADLKELINNALNFTLSRTIMTTATVFIAVVILFLFGGEALKGFSFAMLIGVLFGSYSTLFIAVPMVLDLWKDAPTKAKVEAKEKINLEK